MELRKDYILDKWVLVSEGRGKRPVDFCKRDSEKQTFCVFCKGSEDKTPLESYSVRKEGEWKVRVIPNKFAAVSPSGDPAIQTHNIFYTFSGGHGAHEVVIETPDHGKKFGDLEKDELVDVLKTYSARINKLLEDATTRYVCLFKNEGRGAGASINHTHSQIISLGMIPPFVSEKLIAIKNYEYCPYCDIINREKNSYRRCYENDSFVAFTPYASRFNYEIWIFPKKHILTFEDIDEKGYNDLAQIMKLISQRLEKENIDFDIAWYYSPKGENLHFHIEVMPRIALLAGFEIGFGVTINTVSPESAAKFYRGEI